jgi:ubiquinone biosynthesis protein Coq4
MAESGTGDAGALTVGLRHGVTALGLRSLAAKAVHVAAAAPERMADIYDNAAAGWLSGPVFPPRLRTAEPLPISPGFWRVFWELVTLPADVRRNVFAERTMALAGELDPRISARMAGAALEFPGVAEAAAGGVLGPFDLDAMGDLSPASLGYILREETRRGAGVASPFGRSIIPLLRHMQAPLNYINIEVIQSFPLLAMVGGYGPSRLDQVGMAGFLMGQAGHHYSALSTAVTLTVMSIDRPKSLEAMLDCVFKGWRHGRETPLLLAAPWEDVWRLRVDQVREALGVTPFDSPVTRLTRALESQPKPH